MKRLFLSSVSILLTSFAIVPFAQASNGSGELKPNELVNLAYNGYFHEQGVPGFGLLISDYRQGKITAEELVQAAIDSNRAEAEVNQDEGYIFAVDRTLLELSQQPN